MSDNYEDEHLKVSSPSSEQPNNHKPSPDQVRSLQRTLSSTYCFLPHHRHHWHWGCWVFVPNHFCKWNILSPLLCIKIICKNVSEISVHNELYTLFSPENMYNLEDCLYFWLASGAIWNCNILDISDNLIENCKAIVSHALPQRSKVTALVVKKVLNIPINDNSSKDRLSYVWTLNLYINFFFFTYPH